jgi:hypothetical protein
VASRTPEAALPVNAWTLLLSRSILARGQLHPYLHGAHAGGWNNGKSGADHNVRLLNVDASPQEGMIFQFAGQASGGWWVFEDLRVRPVPTSGSSPNR